VRDRALGAYAHQDLPFEKLVEAISPDRDPNRTPLFQVKMVLQNAPIGELSLPGLALSPITTMTDTAKFDLLLNLNDTGHGLSVSLQYNTGLFEESTSTRILHRFHALLERIVERPDARLEELIEPLIAADKRDQLGKKSELRKMLETIKRKPSMKRT
jgi:non-ribosomal peptide synthetase component F